MAESLHQSLSPAEPPHSIAQAKVDEKGRLKLPVAFLEYLKTLGVSKVFITTVDLRLARIYPIPVWNANESLFEDAGELAELAEDIAYVAKYYGGDSDIDKDGRVLLPSELRKALELESQPVWLDVYHGRINVSGRKVHEERMQRALVNLGEKVKSLDKKGMK